MLSTLQGIIGVVFAFSVAIFVHELGHFMFAKLFRVRVETFSIGFGKKLLKFRRGDTEYAISAIPFGGYVKMVGTLSKELEDVIEGKTPATEEEREDAGEAAEELSAPAGVSLAEGIQDEVNALRNKAYWQKLLVFSAGCLNNILTAVLIYFLLFWIGYNAPPAADATVGRISAMPEEVSPIKTNDKIVAINNENIDTYSDFVTWFAEKENPEDFNGPINVQVLRGGTTVPVELPLAAPVMPQLPAGEIVSVNGEEVESALAARQEVSELLERETTDSISIIVKTDAGTTTVKAPAIAAAGPWWPALTVVPAGPARIELVLPNLPAEKAGIKNGDIILAINDEPVKTSAEATILLRDLVGQTVPVTVERQDGRSTSAKELALEIRPNPDNPNVGQIGVMFGGQRTELIKMPFGEALSSAFVRTGDMVVAYWNALKRILSSSFTTIRENLAGPVGISVQFFKTAQSGWFNFVLTFAMFNIVLALTNLLPLPVLDGGHILFATIEAIIRRPLPAKFMVMVYNLFTFLIIGLALMITFNDVIMNFWRLPFLGGGE